MPSTSATGKPTDRTDEQRRIQFKAACAFAKTTVEQWCVENDVTTGHLYQVLRGVRPSPPLLEKVDAFIDRYVPANAA